MLRCESYLSINMVKSAIDRSMTSAVSDEYVLQKKPLAESRYVSWSVAWDVA